MRLLFLYLLAFPYIIYAQEVSTDDYRYLKRHEHINISLEQGDLKIVKQVLEEAEYLTGLKLYYASESLAYDSFNSIEDIEAYTYIPSTHATINVNHIETKKAFDNGIFYSDQQTKDFTFPAVTKGAITTLKYKEIVKEPQFLGLFRFGTFVATQNAQLSISLPEDVSLGYILYNTEERQLNFTKEKTKNIITYTWTATDVPPYQLEEDGESPMYFMPHIILYIKNYKHDGKIINIFNDVDDLYQWYVSLNHQIDTSNLGNVYHLADQITKGQTSAYDKTQAIFNWVQNQINYVAFEDGLDGFIPRNAASVSNKRYGDCKDMANLLFEMLNHVGVKAYRTWIGTRDRPYSYRDVPTPMVDNHMITTAIIDGKLIFLDATDSTIPFGLPTTHIQSKEALIGISDSEYRIVSIDPVKADANTTNVISRITLDQMVFNVKEERQLNGYEKSEFILAYTYKGEGVTDAVFLNKRIALAHNKTKYSNFTKAYSSSPEEGLELKFNLELTDYIKTVGQKIYINMDIDRTLSKSRINLKTKKYGKKIDYKFIKNYTTTLVIPEGYKVTYLPEVMSFENEAYGFTVSYEQNGSEILQKKQLHVNTLSVEPDNFEHWNEFISSLNKSYKKSLILEPK